MSEIIKLPAGTKRIPVYEIPSLLASAKATTSLLINFEKKVASSEQTLPLSDDDAKRLTEIWGIETDLNVLFRITKEKWLELEATFNNSENKPDWSLVPIWEEFPSIAKEREIHQSVDNNIAYGKGDFKLTIRHPITNAPINDSVPDAFVTIEEFIRYARIVHLVDVQLECEPDPVPITQADIDSGSSINITEMWIAKAWEQGTIYMEAWRKAGYDPTIANIGLYLEGYFSDNKIYNSRNEIIDKATIVREALTGITGNKVGHKTKKSKIPDGKVGKLPQM
jgi:hypothetical protein